MPIINDSTNLYNNSKLSLIQVLNTFAFLLKKITGEDSWKVPASISLADLAQNQGGLPGEKGDKGDKGDPGEPAPLEHRHAIAQIEGLQTALDSKSLTEHQHAIAQVEGLQAALEASLVPSPHPGFTSGRYYSCSTVQSTAGLTCSSGFIYYTYFFVPLGQAFTKIAFQTTTTTSFNIGIAIYKVTNGLPSNLVRNLGFTSFGAPAGVKEVPAVVTLEAGWYAIAMMLSTNNIGFITCTFSLTNFLGLLTPSSSTNLSGFRNTLAYGFFPSTAPTANIENNPTPLFWLKAA